MIALRRRQPDPLSILDINQSFDATLLSLPIPKLRDTSEDLWRTYIWIKEKLIKKCLTNSVKLKRCLELEKQFLELYERAKAKEKEREGQKKHCTQEPFYRFRETGRNYRWVFGRLRIKSYQWLFSLYRKNSEVPEK